MALFLLSSAVFRLHLPSLLPDPESLRKQAKLDASRGNDVRLVYFVTYSLTQVGNAMIRTNIAQTLKVVGRFPSRTVVLPRRNDTHPSPPTVRSTMHNGAAMTNQTVLTLDEVADIFKVSRRTIQNWRANTLTFPQPLDLPGRALRWRHDQITAFLEEMTTPVPGTKLEGN